jgi:hypothetical protein
MSSFSQPDKQTAQALNQKAIAGIDTYFAHVKTLTLAGTKTPPVDLKATFQAEIDADVAADKAHAEYTQQVVAAKLARSKGRAARKNLKAYVLANYGSEAVQMLKDLGISAPKPASRTAESKAQAAEKAVATRKAKKDAIASIAAARQASPIGATATPTPAAVTVTPPKS